ncbi:MULTISPECIES: hypothetical protein [unclassified Pseudomonas]|uniref:hypothetical protein n=1 Tax=unclassified Pseudomonas TaxID=196821 RepID=UPI00131E1C6C|nr:MULTISPECIES: hypothetical protein [unclassified Pseudomonas]
MSKKSQNTHPYVVGLDIGYSNVKRVEGYADGMRPVNPPCVILRSLLAQTFAFISVCV